MGWGGGVGVRLSGCRCVGVCLSGCRCGWGCVLVGVGVTVV